MGLPGFWKKTINTNTLVVPDWPSIWITLIGWLTYKTTLAKRGRETGREGRKRDQGVYESHLRGNCNCHVCVWEWAQTKPWWTLSLVSFHEFCEGFSCCLPLVHLCFSTSPAFSWLQWTCQWKENRIACTVPSDDLCKEFPSGSALCLCLGTIVRLEECVQVSL